MRTYIQLTQEQRYQIKALLKIDQDQTQIAKVVGVNKSTLSRELRRNCGQRGYRPKLVPNPPTPFIHSFSPTLLYNYPSCAKLQVVVRSIGVTLLIAGLIWLGSALW